MLYILVVFTAYYICDYIYIIQLQFQKSNTV